MTDIAKDGRESKEELLPAASWKGKKLGVIGLGAIGVLVANAAQSILGWKCMAMTHIMSVESAWKPVQRNPHMLPNCGRDLSVNVIILQFMYRLLGQYQRA